MAIMVITLRWKDNNINQHKHNNKYNCRGERGNWVIQGIRVAEKKDRIIENTKNETLLTIQSIRLQIMYKFQIHLASIVGLVKLFLGHTPFKNSITISLFPNGEKYYKQ